MRLDLVMVAFLGAFVVLGCAEDPRGNLGLDDRCKGEYPVYLSFCEVVLTPWGRRI
jgi:hypothetical protein